MMFKKSLGALTLLAGMMLCATSAFAQSSNTNDNTATGSSTVNTNSRQSTTSNNQGVSAVVNSYGADHIHSSINSQVPISVVGYGSFSQNNCSNAVGVGATTKIFSFVYNAPKPEKNCQHAVRSDQFGRESQLAKSQNKPVQAEILRSAGVWETCTADPQTTAMCIRMGLIAYVNPDHRDLKLTKPNPQFAENSRSRVVGKVRKSIPNHPKGWTNAEFLKKQGITPRPQIVIKDHSKDTSKTTSQSSHDQRGANAVSQLPWVQRNAK